LLPADRADERRRPISENLRNLREAFLLPVRKASRNDQKGCRPGTRPAGLRQNSLKVMFDFLPDSSEWSIVNGQEQSCAHNHPNVKR
jgi:hypothetical protein